jgi:hypothetical protein
MGNFYIDGGSVVSTETAFFSSESGSFLGFYAILPSEPVLKPHPEIGYFGERILPVYRRSKKMSQASPFLAV